VDRKVGFATKPTPANGARLSATAHSSLGFSFVLEQRGNRTTEDYCKKDLSKEDTETLGLETRAADNQTDPTNQQRDQRANKTKSKKD